MSAGTAGRKEKAMTMQELAGQVDERMAGEIGRGQRLC